MLYFVIILISHFRSSKVILDIYKRLNLDSGVKRTTEKKYK